MLKKKKGLWLRQICGMANQNRTNMEHEGHVLTALPFLLALIR